MKLIVNPHRIEIIKTPVNEKEINVTKCEFEFAEEITDDFVKDVYFTFNGTTYQQANIQNNECDIPYEVLSGIGTVEIGVVAYLVENGEEITRYNPSPAYYANLAGSLKEEYENTEPITPTDKEQIEQQLLNISTQMDNIDIEAEKQEHTTTITVTRKDGTSYQVEVLDGEKGDKGDKGDAGAIKMLIVAELPQTGQDDTIYLVPLENPDIQGNNYAEYVYINGAWELLGKIGVQVDLTDYYTKQETYSKGEVNNLIPDLTDYVTNTDYATYDNAGVIKYGNGLNVGDTGRTFVTTRTYEQYQNDANSYFIGKGTLENVITGKQLTDKTYVDTLVGDISSALDSINGEVI